MADDGELERTKIGLEVHRLEYRYNLAMLAVRGVLVIVGVATSYLPLTVLADMVEPLAGETTVVDANVALSASLTVSVVVNVLQASRGRFRKREIQRIRERSNNLEGGLGL